MPKILLSWSSGKDSAWTLHLLRRQGVQVDGLLTTTNQAFDRVAMHAVRRTLVEKQAAAAGLPLWTVPLPWPCSNAEYESIMSEVCRKAVTEGYDTIAFGDLFLTEVREYRERTLHGTGLQPIFPVWGLPTTTLAAEMIADGLRAKITCIDPKLLPAALAGSDFDDAFLKALPPGTDPCGEKGEFHSFVYDGPMFRQAVPVSVGEVVERDGFVFADLTSSGS